VTAEKICYSLIKLHHHILTGTGSAEKQSFSEESRVTCRQTAATASSFRCSFISSYPEMWMVCLISFQMTKWTRWLKLMLSHNHRRVIPAWSMQDIAQLGYPLCMRHWLDAVGILVSDVLLLALHQGLNVLRHQALTGFM
jgi:hypothetical protein